MLDILLLNSKKSCEDIGRCRWLCSWHVQSWHWHWLMCFGVRSYITSFVLESCFQIFYEHSKSVEVSYDLHEVASYSIWFAYCRASWLDLLGSRLPSFCVYANCNPSLVVFKAAWWPNQCDPLFTYILHHYHRHYLSSDLGVRYGTRVHWSWYNCFAKELAEAVKTALCATQGAMCTFTRQWKNILAVAVMRTSFDGPWSYEEIELPLPRAREDLEEVLPFHISCKYSRLHMLSWTIIASSI